MNELPEIDARTFGERVTAAELATSFLPTAETGAQPRYYWSTPEHHVTVWRDMDDRGYVNLNVLEKPVEDEPGSNVNVRLWRLHTYSGTFEVHRMIGNRKEFRGDIARHVLALSDMERALGMLRPEPEDWGKFMDLLAEGQRDARKKKFGRFGWISSMVGQRTK